MRDHYRKAAKDRLEIARRLLKKGETSPMSIWFDAHTAIATIRTVMTYDPECSVRDAKVMGRLEGKLLRRGLK